MSTSPATASTSPGSGSSPTAHRGRSFWTGRGELVVVALLFAMAILLTAGIATMEVLGNSTPGPKFFPIVVCVLLYATATALAVHVLRHPHLPATEQSSDHGNFSTNMLHDLGHIDDQQSSSQATTARAWTMHSDWKALGQILGAAIVFILLLKIVGWILCAAFLFWSVAYALGSKRPVFDIGVALLFSSAIQLAFNAGLGLPLPAGFIGGLF